MEAWDKLKTLKFILVGKDELRDERSHGMNYIFKSRHHHKKSIFNHLSPDGVVHCDWQVRTSAGGAYSRWRGGKHSKSDTFQRNRVNSQNIYFISLEFILKNWYITFLLQFMMNIKNKPNGINDRLATPCFPPFVPTCADDVTRHHSTRVESHHDLWVSRWA